MLPSRSSFFALLCSLTIHATMMGTTTADGQQFSIHIPQSTFTIRTPKNLLTTRDMNMLITGSATTICTCSCIVTGIGLFVSTVHSLPKNKRENNDYHYSSFALKLTTSALLVGIGVLGVLNGQQILGTLCPESTH